MTTTEPMPSGEITAEALTIGDAVEPILTDAAGPVTS